MPTPSGPPAKLLRASSPCDAACRTPTAKTVVMINLMRRSRLRRTCGRASCAMPSTWTTSSML
eukprot:2477415-Pleurochrysis_carterae.AAC.1